MGTVVVHMDKAKKGQSGGLTLHIDRTQKEISANIDASKMHLNFELVKTNGSIDEMINTRIKIGYSGTKKIRKDAVVCSRFILSGAHEDMVKLSEHQLRSWAVDNYRFFIKMYGEENIVRATVHLDEKTPHMHLIVVPLTEDGKLSAKQFLGTPQKLAALQTNYAKEVGAKYGLERGVRGSNRRHITTADFYRFLEKTRLQALEILKHPSKALELIAKLIEISIGKDKGLEKIAHWQVKQHHYEKTNSNNKNISL